MKAEKIDKILSHVFNMAGRSELKGIDYEAKEFIDGTKLQGFSIGDYKALRNQIVAVAKNKQLLQFHYEGLEVENTMFILNAQIPEVLLYIRDKQESVSAIASKLEMSTAGAYKFIDRVRSVYESKLDAIWCQRDIHILLGLTI